MTRILGALAAGLGVAIVLMMAIEAIGNHLFPPPLGYDLGGKSAVSLPVQTLIWPVIGWFVGALVGAWLAVRICTRPWTGWLVAAFVLAATLFNFALIAHPMWMLVAGVIAPLLGGWIGQRLGQARRRSAP